jgi:hypothetical protein
MASSAPENKIGVRAGARPPAAGRIVRVERLPETILGVPVRAPSTEQEPVLETVIDLTGPRPTNRRPGPRGLAEGDHARVALLVSTGIRPGDAIARVALDTGKARDTIQNNYYRTKRKLSAQTPSRTPEAVSKDRGRQAAEPLVIARRTRPLLSKVGGSDIDAIASQLIAATEALAAAATAQATELAEIRARLAAARRELR